VFVVAPVSHATRHQFLGLHRRMSRRGAMAMGVVLGTRQQLQSKCVRGRACTWAGVGRAVPLVAAARSDRSPQRTVHVRAYVVTEESNGLSGVAAPVATRGCATRARWRTLSPTDETTRRLGILFGGSGLYPSRRRTSDSVSAGTEMVRSTGEARTHHGGTRGGSGARTSPSPSDPRRGDSRMWCPRPRALGLMPRSFGE
jgi:hypothetical protein